MDMESRPQPCGAEAGPRSLADVASWLESDTQLKPRQKADYRSALATLVNITGKPLQHLPAHAGRIRRMIDARSPAECGMKTPSYRNFRSRIHQLLAKAGCRVVPGRHRDPRSPEWQARWDSLDQHRRLRYDLSHLM